MPCVLRQMCELEGKERNLNLANNSTRGKTDKSGDRPFKAASFLFFFLFFLLLLKYSFLKASSTTVMVLM